MLNKLVGGELCHWCPPSILYHRHTRPTRTCVCSGKEGAGEGRFCLDKGNYSRDCGMPQWRVVNKQSNLITVTSYTPFRHQRERWVWSKCLSRNSCLCGLPRAWAGREVIGGHSRCRAGPQTPPDSPLTHSNTTQINTSHISDAS